MILQGVEFPIFLLIFAWALQQCSAKALPVIQSWCIDRVTPLFTFRTVCGHYLRVRAKFRRDRMNGCMDTQLRGYTSFEPFSEKSAHRFDLYEGSRKKVGQSEKSQKGYI